MSHTPRQLRRFWPLLKRVHRALTQVAGFGFRRLSGRLGERGVPVRGTTRSVQTAEREPDSVTIHGGGAAEAIDRQLPAGDPPGHPLFAGELSAAVPGPYCIEAVDGRLVGDFGALITAGGTLDYQTSGYFGIAGWREHPLFLRPTIGEVEHLAGRVLSLTARGTAVNYYHFLYDAVARYGIVEACMPGAKFDAIVVPHQASYQRQILQLLGLTGTLVQPAARRTLRADRLVVPSTPNQDLDAPPSLVHWLRDRLRPTPTGDEPARLYLTRGAAANSRRYTQEAELVPHLEDRGFVVLDPGTLSVQEQINVFHRAEMVVAPHGAGLTNITFCEPGARVLELFAPTYVHKGLWTIADAVDGVTYRYLVGDGAGRDELRMTGPYDDISIPAARVVTAVDELLESK